MKSFLCITIIFSMQLTTSMVYAEKVNTPTVSNIGGKRTLLLPDTLLSVVQKKYPGFRIPDYDDVKGLRWTFEYKEGRFPWAVWGDFTGNGYTDVALMIVNDKEWKKIILNNTGHGYKIAFDAYGNKYDLGEGVRDEMQDFYMYKIKRGSNYAIQSGVYESEFSIILWKDGAYQTIHHSND